MPQVFEIRSARFALGCGFLAAAMFCGCSGRTNPENTLASVNESNLQRLANLYIAFQSTHDWRGPQDEVEFKAFVRGCKPEKLERIGIDPNQIDALFISERDGEPFKIRYKVPGTAMGSSEPVVFESTGDGSTRLVGYLNMEQRELAAAEYEAAWAAAPALQKNSRP